MRIEEGMATLHPERRKGAFHRFLVITFEVVMGRVLALPRYSLCKPIQGMVFALPWG